MAPSLNGPRKFLFVVAALLVVMMLGIFAVRRLHRTQDRTPNTTTAAAPQSTVTTEPGMLTKPAPKAAEPLPSPVTASVETPGSEPKDISSKDLLNQMWALVRSGAPITQEQAAKFKKDLEELIARGAMSVPAIRDFLAKNVDSDFGDSNGTDELGFSSMRATMIDALKKIGGPESILGLEQVLQSSAVPNELLDVANGLDAQAPGQFRNEILKAAHEALEMATANQLGTNVELGPAYRILNVYGEALNAESATAREPASFTQAMQLANQPNGEGLPALLQMAQNPSPQASGRILATEMIAQLAASNDEALKSLLQMAGNDQISNRAWTLIAPILAGGEFQADPNATGAPFTLVDTATTPAQVKDRMEILNHFLQSLDPGSAGASALRAELQHLQTKIN